MDRSKRVHTSIRVVNIKTKKVKFVTKEVAEGAAVKMGWYVEDDQYEMINGKVVEKLSPVKQLDNKKVKIPEDWKIGDLPPFGKSAPDPEIGTPVSSPEEDFEVGGVVVGSITDKEAIIAKYLPDGNYHWSKVKKAIMEATPEEAKVLAETNTCKAIKEVLEIKLKEA